MTTQPLRFIQVGLGGWGRDWMQVVRLHPDATTVAFVDANPEALRLAVERGAPPERCFASLADALGAADADAALVTTGALAHAPVCLAALGAGLPVLVEKPFAPTIAEAREVVRVAAERKLTVMVSQNYRFHPAPQLAARLVREGALGAVGVVEVDFRRDNARMVPPATAHHLLAQPLLMDMAIHHFDLMRFVLGREPVSVECHAFNPPWSPFRDPASAAATIEFEGGAVVSYRGSWASSGPVTPWAGEWRMDAALGELAWTSRESPPPDRVVWRALGGAPEVLDLPGVAQLDRAGAVSAFVRAVWSGEAPVSSGEDNLRSLALTLASIRSAQERRPVGLEEELLALS